MIVNRDRFKDSFIDVLAYTLAGPTRSVRRRDVRQDDLLRIAEVVGRPGAQIALLARALPVPEGLRGRDASGGPTTAALRGEA